MEARKERVKEEEEEKEETIEEILRKFEGTRSVVEIEAEAPAPEEYKAVIEQAIAEAEEKVESESVELQEYLSISDRMFMERVKEEALKGMPSELRTELETKEEYKAKEELRKKAF